MNKAAVAESANSGLARETVEQFGWLVKSLAAKFAGEAASLRSDLEQIGFEELIKATGAWRPGKQAIATFAYTRIRGAMLNHLERWTRGKEIPADTIVGEDEAGVAIALADILVDEQDGAEALLARHQQVQILRKGIGEVLSDKEREVLMFRFDDDLSLEDIGKLLGVSDEAVRKRLEKGCQKLRRYLEVNE